MKLEDLQEVIRRTYYDRDRERGLERTFMWFCEEVGELSKAIREGKNVELEFSDVMAWLVSLANLMDIDISKAMERYAQGCPKCSRIPCMCEKEERFGKEEA